MKFLQKTLQLRFELGLDVPDKLYHAAPENGTTIEGMIGGLPGVRTFGLNTRQASNFAGLLVDASGNATLPGTLAVTGAATLSSTVAITGVATPTGGIAAAGGLTQSPRCTSTGNRGATSLTQGTDTAFVTTDTYIAETYIEGNVTITGVSVLMGSVAGNNNLNVALADSTGKVVAKSATTTTSGTSTTYTQVAFTAPYAAVGPATYYVLIQGASTSDKFRAHAAGNFGQALKTSETYGTFATTYTVPTTFTAAQGPIADLY